MEILWFMPLSPRMPHDMDLCLVYSSSSGQMLPYASENGGYNVARALKK